MPSVVRAITQLQDADDFSGSLTNNYIPVWSTATGKFVMTNILNTAGGTVTGNIIFDVDVDNNRSQLRFANPGALRPAPWLLQTSSAGTENHDNVLTTFYNGYKTPSGSVTRIAEGEHVVRLGLESRWVAVGDPNTIRGMFEWNIQIARNLTGAPSFDRTPFYLTYDFDLDRTGITIGDASSTGASIFTVNHGYAVIDGAGAQGYGLRVGGLPAWFDAGISLYANARMRYEPSQTWTGANVSFQAMLANVRPNHLSSAYLLDVGSNTVGGGADRVQNFNMVRLNGSTATKGTSDIIISASPLHITVPTIGLFNAAISIGNQTDGDWCIRSSSTKASKLDGQLRAASIGISNSESATLPGNVVRKIQIFNESGISLGFIAIYDTII